MRTKERGTIPEGYTSQLPFTKTLLYSSQQSSCSRSERNMKVQGKGNYNTSCRFPIGNPVAAYPIKEISQGCNHLQHKDSKVKEAPPELSSNNKIINITLQYLHIQGNKHQKRPIRKKMQQIHNTGISFSNMNHRQSILPIGMSSYSCSLISTV